MRSWDNSPCIGVASKTQHMENLTRYDEIHHFLLDPHLEGSDRRVHHTSVDADECPFRLFDAYLTGAERMDTAVVEYLAAV